MVVDIFIESFNNSRLVWGLTMLLLNFGARFIIADLGKFHETILTNEYFKKLIIFSIFFVATRDVIYAFLLTILYIIIIDGILNEKKPYCLIPDKYRSNGEQNKISEVDYNRAKQIVSEYEQSVSKQNNNKKEPYFNYANSMIILNNLAYKIK